MSSKMIPLFNWLGGRRAAITLGCSFVCTALVWFGKIDGAIFRDIIIGTVGLYIGGNTWEAVKSARTSESDSAAG